MYNKKLVIILSSAILLFTSIVIVYASIHNGETDNVINKFNDISKTDWFYDDVLYVNEKGLMSGTNKSVFSPNETMTRAMIVTVLWRLEDQPAGGDITFEDVKSDAYYYNAVAWASANKIVSGYDENIFGSDDAVTREQLAAIFYRYAEYKGYDISKKDDLSKYNDLEMISGYAINALEWTVANSIITGTSENAISPQGNALRCQVAAILKRFCNAYIIDDNSENVTSDSSEKNDAGSRAGGKSSSNSSSKTTEKTSNPVIIVSEATAVQGEDVRIIAKIENNPGILGMTLTLNYDENALTLKNAESGSAFRDVLDFTNSKTLSSGSRFVWDGVDIANDKIKDGEILIMDFHVLENAESGKYPISLNCTEGDIVDNNLNVISVVTETGYITVEK